MAGGCRQGGAVDRVQRPSLQRLSCSAHFVLLFLLKIPMTVLQPASWHDVLFMEDFLECASAAFDTIPVGVSVAAVDVMFRR